MIKTITNTKKMDNIQSGMKSNKKVHKDLFKMMKFCAAFCCLLLCTVVNVQAQAPTLTPTPLREDGDTIRTDHTTGAVQIAFNVGGGATGWTHAITGGDFITIGGDTANATTTTGDITVTAIPTANTDMDAVDRSATVRITTIGGAGDSATFAVTITQSASSFDFRVNRPGTITNPDGSLQASIANISAAGDTTESDPIQFRVIPATADVTITHSHFIRVDTSSSLGTATPPGGGAAVPERVFLINYRLLANNTGADRTETVTFTARSSVGSQTFTVTFTQGVAPLPSAGFGEITIQTGDFSLDAIRDPNVGHIAVLLGLPTSTTTLLSIGLVGTDITDLDSLMFLQSLTEHLIIDGTNITSLRGLDNLTRIDGNLIIQNNSMLTSLEGLEALTNVGGYVIIRDNGVLTSLAGLSSLGTIGGDVTIQANASLTLCCESATLAAAIDAVRIRDGEIGLHTTISGNGSDNCNDVNELVGCSGTLPQAPDPPTLDITSVLDTLGHDNGSTITIGFATNGTWTATSDESFIRLSSTNGAASDAAEVTATAASANTTGMLRTATITIKSNGPGGITTRRTMVSQEAAPMLTITSPTAVTLDHDATTANDIFVTLGGSALGWSAESSDESFIMLTSSTGTGGTIEITVVGTPTVSRTAEITITTTGSKGTPVSEMVTITQEAAPVVPAAPTVSISTPDTTVEANDISDISVAFMVGGNATGWGSNIIYTPVGSDFITLDTDMNTDQTGDITIQATPIANTGIERIAKIVISTKGPDNAVSDTLTITQAGAPPTLVVSVPTLQEGNNDTTIAYNAIINAFDIIEFTVGGGAERWIADVIDGDDANDFLTLVSDEGDAGGTNTISVTVVENTGGERMDTVVITTVGGTGVLTDTIIVTQEAVPTIAVTSSDEITIDHDVTAAQTITFNVGGSATGWRVTSNHDSITLSPTSGSSGTGQEVMATFTENRDVLRAATITIITTGQLGDSVTAEVTITQTGAPGSPALEITTPGDTTVAYTATPTSDSVEIAFTVGNAMGWESMISYGVGVDTFLTLTGNPSDTGEVRIKVAVTENVGVARSAKIVLSTTGQGSFSSAKDSLTITQGGAPPTFMLTSANTDTIAHNAETARDITFNVGGGATGWSSNIVYTPDVNSGGEEFITLTGEKDMRGDITVTVASRVNTGIERSAVITIATVGGTGDALNTMITITQRAAPVNPPTLIVSTNDTTISHDATDAFEISFTLGGDARGWQSTSTGDDFITLTPEQNTTATGKVTIMATASVNATGSERMQTITFVTTGGVTDMITITQRAAPPAAAPTISISTMDTTIEASATTAAINLVFTVGGSAMGWSSNVVYTPAGANFITFTPTQNANEKGEVTIKVTPAANTKARRVAKIVITPTGGTGTAVSDSITITQKTGEEETDLGISLDESLTLYPNPTDGLFFIEGLSGALEVHVHDLLGRQVATYSLSAGERNVDVSALSSGMYVVTLKESGGELLTRILIKQ